LRVFCRNQSCRNGIKYRQCDWHILYYIIWLIDCCLTPTLAVFQLCRGLNKFYKLIYEDH
jgi:hypothetical protein